MQKLVVNAFLHSSVALSDRLTLKRHAIGRDILMLLKQFQSLNCTSFQRFKSECWDKFQFLSVHFVCTNTLARQGFMHELYAQILRFLHESQPYHRQVGALFALYAVFVTQPPPQIHRIPLVPSTYQQIVKIVAQASTDGDGDVLSVLRLLFLKQHAFKFECYDSTVDELVDYLKLLDENTQAGVPDYQKVREEVWQKLVKESSHEIASYKPSYALDRLKELHTENMNGKFSHPLMDYDETANVVSQLNSLSSHRPENVFVGPLAEEFQADMRRLIARLTATTPSAGVSTDIKDTIEKKQDMSDLSSLFAGANSQLDTQIAEIDQAIPSSSTVTTTYADPLDISFNDYPEMDFGMDLWEDPLDQDDFYFDDQH